MNLRKFAIRGLIVLAVVVALCMFFSGTIKTITTAKIRVAQATTGRLEEEVDLNGALAFPQVDRVGHALEDGQSLTIARVNVRPGYEVKEGDVVIEARVADYENALKEQQSAYDEALEGLLELESKNAGIRLRPSDEQYADAYFALRDAMKASAARRIEMEALLAAEGLKLPDSGAPEGASEALVKAIEAWRAADSAEQAAQAAMDGVSRYAPDETTWTYITQKHDFEEKMAEAESKMAALSELNAAVQAIRAPHDGYIAEVAVKVGDTYDGSGNLFTMTAQDAPPVLRAGDLEMDCAAHSVRKNGAPIDLTAKEYAILQLLLAHPNRVYTKAQLYSAVWEDAYLGDENAVNVHISRLRAKVEDDPRQPRYVCTVWGIGYKLGDGHE